MQAIPKTHLRLGPAVESRRSRFDSIVCPNRKEASGGLLVGSGIEPVALTVDAV